MEMIVVLVGRLRGASVVTQVPDTAEHRARVSLTPVLAVAFPVLWEEAPRRKGSPLASQSCVDFKVLFSRLLADQNGICPPFSCFVVRHSICVYPAGSFPRVELTGDLLIAGQGTRPFQAGRTRA